MWSLPQNFHITKDNSLYGRTSVRGFNVVLCRVRTSRKIGGECAIVAAELQLERRRKRKTSEVGNQPTSGVSHSHSPVIDFVISSFSRLLASQLASNRISFSAFPADFAVFWISPKAVVLLWPLSTKRITMLTPVAPAKHGLSFI
jgi:hypothetical protein